MSATSLATLRDRRARLAQRAAGTAATALAEGAGAAATTRADLEALLSRLEIRLTRPDVVAPQVSAVAAAALAGARDPLVALALALARPGDNAVDLGAGRGDFCLAVAGTPCAVLAVEGSAEDAAALGAERWRRGLHDLHVVAAPPEEVTLDELLVSMAWGEVALVRMAPGVAVAPALDGMTTLLAGPQAPLLFAHLDAAAMAFLAARGFALFAVAPGTLTPLAPPYPGTPIPALATRHPGAGPAGWEVMPA